ncbi:MAG: hypothetical protein K2K12_02260 [Clostridia bacterium]|nr:hypothetical protein [Clostridia bacterium]
MQIELQQLDMQCLEAIREAGGYAVLSDCLVYLYRQDIEVSYEEIRDSFTRLLQGKFISCNFSVLHDLYHIKKRGKAVLRGEITSFEERKKIIPFANSLYLNAKVDAMEKMEAGESTPPKSLAGWNILSAFLTALSLALLAGGVILASLLEVKGGWIVAFVVAGLVLYCIV